MAQGRNRRMAAMAVAIGLVAGACSGSDSSSTTSAVPTPIGGDSNVDALAGVAPRTFGLQLSQGEAVAAEPETTPVVDGQALTDEELADIVVRLPKWSDAEAAREEFNWPIQTSPPPRTGVLIDVPFPPADSTPPPEVPSGPLEVLRFQPEGDVSIAPYIAITFNQPMVSVGTVGQVATADLPITLTPDVPGRWQWIGTRTLRFDASGGEVDRLPMATTFTVTVPAGTESATGGALADAVSWQFTTPPPTVQSFAPEGDQMHLDQVYVVTFDQLVDPAAVLASIRLEAGSEEVSLRLATAEEIEADDTARAMVENAQDGRWVAFRATDLLPGDTPISVFVGPGTPSAEGPAVSEQPFVYTGRTYAPLRIVSTTCNYSNDCWPGSSISVEFNNPLDTKASDTAAVTVAPALAAANAGISYNTLVIDGVTLANTEYRITIPAGFTDVYGQTLGEAETVTIEIDSTQPTLVPFESITTLDPFSDEQQLSVLSTNHDDLRVRVFAADPAMFNEYLRYQWERDNPDTPLPGWEVLSDATLTIDGDQNRMLDTPIDLGGVLDGTFGHVIVLVEPIPTPSPSSDEYWSNRPTITWAQSTNLGVDAFSDNRNATTWVTDLRTGAPVPDVALSLTGGASGTTDADGLATLTLPASSGIEESVLVATAGDDSAVLPIQAFASQQFDEARWFVFDDRQVYRPGETMRVKGWVRRLTLSTDAELEAIGDGAVKYVVYDSFGNEVLTGSTPLAGLGGFDLDLDVPAAAALGSAWISFELEGASMQSSYSHQFQIQEFRRPEFEVTTRAESTLPFISTKTQTIAATGAYYAGGALSDAPVDWVVSTTPSTYSPPGWDEFTFGIWTPWWFDSFEGYGGAPYAMDYSGPCCGQGETTVEEYSGTTDAAGTHYLQLEFEGTDGVLPDLPVTVQASATITDVNRQAWSSSTGLLVHAADRYVGLRSSRTFVRQGDPLTIEAVVTDIDGAAVTGVSFDVVAGRVQSTWTDGEYVEEVVDPQTCTVTAAAEPVVCEFDTTVGGQYRVTALIAGSDGGRNRTELTTWVSGAEAQPSRNVAQETLTVVPDQAEYAPGDTAELLVQAPFATGEGLVTISRNGIREVLRFSIVDGSAVVQVPITEASVPQLSLTLEVVGATPRTADDGTPLPDVAPRPAYAVGGITLSVPPASRTLDVTATPRDTELTPGESTTIDVSVTDASGNAVEGAEFAVVVVDEAVLSLSGYTLADPLAVFYGPGYDWVNAVYGRQQIRLIEPTKLVSGSDDAATSDTQAASEEMAPATTMVAAADADRSAGGSAEYSTAAGDGSAGPAVDVRSNFDALALFEPTVVTDAAGNASIDVTLPDNLTRYRVMVVAVSGADRFGSAESNLTARLPLSVRPSAPRFANFGDTFELPVVVQNQSDQPMDVEVVLQTSNLDQPGDTTATGQRVTVPANDRVEVRFPVATDSAGTASFRVTAVSGAFADSATVELPVYTPATAEAFATYGVIDSNGTLNAIEQPLVAPDGVVPGFGGLEVTTSSTSLQALTDAVLYLLDYEWDSSDGHASRIMAIAALADVLEAFESEQLPSKATIDAAVVRDIAALAAMQNDDGGFPFWQKYRESAPFNSVQAVHALLLARQHGYAVSDDTLARGLAFLADIENYFPAGFSPQERASVSAYALWTRALAGQRDPAKALALYERDTEDHTPDVLAWLWGSIDSTSVRDEIERTLGNSVVETAGAANFVTDYGDAAYLVMHSDRRTDGIVLEALIANARDSDLIPKVVNGLLANRVKGRWDNVQENSFILLALRAYFDEFESQSPEFIARVWLGEQFAGEHTFSGRETDRANFVIPTDELIAAGDTELVVANDGSGRLYYRIGLRYAPADLQLDALDRGFVVDRVYEAVDDPGDVTRDADGTWRIKAGARVRVTLTMVAESQRTHVALIDPLPAGLEALNPDLAVTQPVPSDESAEAFPVGGDWWWGWGQWYEHQMLRDDRSEAFTSLLPGGTYTYSYVARATTPGTFVVPPARAEEMYAPETFGRTASDLVIIE
jgi:uncharacterized protein YfaS (alpha-2-macroglobulin family)